MRIGLVGAGKRMSRVYVPLLDKLAASGIVPLEIVGFTTRSQGTADAFIASTPRASPLRYFRTRDELMAQRPDALLVCVSSKAICQVLRTSLRLNVPLLVETPIEDPAIATEVQASGAAVGVLEQWPYLPLEQFKENVYASGLISRPYLVQNDCRSFDYHAIAQLRTYMGRHVMPVTAYGHQVTASLTDFIDHDGTPRTGVVDMWDLGIIGFEGGATLMHNFAYACKTSPLRSMQTLRAVSRDGTIVTGRYDDRLNDYEILDFRYLDGQETHRMDIAVHRADGTTVAIECKRTGVRWDNPFAALGLQDNEVAIATHIRALEMAVNAKGKLPYSINDAVMDEFIIRAIKHSAASKAAVRLK
jgi:predicted dehydrogenase